VQEAAVKTGIHTACEYFEATKTISFAIVTLIGFLFAGRVERRIDFAQGHERVFPDLAGIERFAKDSPDGRTALRGGLKEITGFCRLTTKLSERLDKPNDLKIGCIRREWKGRHPPVRHLSPSTCGLPVGREKRSRE
jgi:hypothetical protein